jgi:hypothetical protein
VTVDEKMTSLAQFEANKQALRNNPESSDFIRWNQILPLCEKIMHGTNTMVFNYALEETKRLGIDVVLQINGKDFNDTWSNKWQQWQRYYALAYHAAKTGDVSMFAMQNEPNHRHSGPMEKETYLSGLQIVSDAVHCAVEDVNKRYGKNLQARMVAPVTAGANTDWWIEVMKNIRTHYSGKPGDRDLIDIFSTHSYNLPASGYTTKVSEIRELITDNHPQKKSLPIVFTETGRWMNARLIDKYETMDSPSLFTEWAGEYVHNTLNGCYGMWAFKMANTASGTYPRGIKSGHHFTWQGLRITEDAYINVAKGKQAFDLTSGVPVKAAEICDGDKSDRSTWTSPLTPQVKCLEIDLKSVCSLGGAVVYTGSSYGVYTGPGRVKNFKLQYLKGDKWIDIKETIEEDAKYVRSFFIFNTPVKTRKIRFVSTDEGSIKVREIKLFDAASMKDLPESYSISGIQRTGEVVRLFAKGFKDERPLLKTVKSSIEQDMDVMVSYDKPAAVYYVWLVQRKTVSDSLTIDLSRLNIAGGARVVAEEVSEKHYGDISLIKPLNDRQSISLRLPAQSVTLLTIPAGANNRYRELPAIAGTAVAGNRYRHELPVEMHAAQPGNDRTVCIRFDVSRIDRDKLQSAVLKVSARTTSGSPYRLHVYATENSHAFIAGEMVAGKEYADCAIDVTGLVRQMKGDSLAFTFIRELRYPGDDAGSGKQFLIQSGASNKQPVLMVW